MSIARALIRHSRPNSLGKHSAPKLVNNIKLVGSMQSKFSIIVLYDMESIAFL